MKKKIIFTTIFISIILIFTGIIMLFVTSRNSINNDTSKKDDKNMEEEIERGTPAPTITNKSDKLKNDHCIDNICIEDLKVTEIYDNAYVIYGTGRNNSNKELKDLIYNLIFTSDDKNIVTWFYIDKVDGNGTFEFQTGGNDKVLLNANDYKITVPTDEELLLYKSNFTE